MLTKCAEHSNALQKYSNDAGEVVHSGCLGRVTLIHSRSCLSMYKKHQCLLKRWLEYLWSS